MTPDFSVRDVLAWARTKPTDESYFYGSLDNCVLAQFVRHAGLPLHGDERSLLERGDAGTAACSSTTFGEFVEHLEPFVPSEWTKLDSYMVDDLAPYGRVM